MLIDEELDAIVIRMELSDRVFSDAKFDTHIIAYSSPIFFRSRTTQACDSCLSISNGEYDIASADPTLVALWNDGFNNSEWEISDSVRFPADSCKISCSEYAFIRTSGVSNEYGKELPLCDSSDRPITVSQSSIMNGTYPMRHGIYVLLRTPGSNPQTGFVSYLLGDSGQRMILKEGLAPVKIPGREINVISE